MRGPGAKAARTLCGRMPFAMSACALVAVAAVAPPADARQGTEQTVNVALSGFNAERIKKAPIAKRSGGKVRVDRP